MAVAVLVTAVVAGVAGIGLVTVAGAPPAGAATAPTVGSVSPAYGPPAGGTLVTVTGTDLTGATAVDFGTAAASDVSVVSPTELTALAPAGSSGTVHVTVTTPAGTSSAVPAAQFTDVTPAQVFTPPATIPDDCSVDVGDTDGSPAGNGPLVDWLGSLPAGTPTDPVVVRFAQHGCYLVNGGLFLRNVRDTVFDGNGATFEQQAVPAADPVLYDAHPPAADYCGTPGTTYGTADTEEDTPPIIWWFDGGCDLTVENMVVEGPYGGTGSGGEAQQDSAFELSGVQRALLTDVSVENVEGDFVTVSGLHEHGGVTYMDAPSTDVTIADNNFYGAGRQGISLVYVDRVLVTDNQLTNVDSDMFDIESDLPGGNSDDIDITGNTVVGNAAYLLAGDTGTAIDNLAFTDNQLDVGGQVKVEMNPQGGMTNATFTGNTAAAVNAAGGYQAPAIAFGDQTDAPESNILVANNTIPSSPWNHGQQMGGAPTVAAGAGVDDLQVRDNAMPLEYGSGVPSTYSSVLPLWQYGAATTLYGANGACGNTQGSTGTIYYGAACTGPYEPPPGPAAPALPGDVPAVATLVPTVGSTLSGTTTLDASARSAFGVVGLQFTLTAAGPTTGNGGPADWVVARATPTLVGYLARWDTTTVPDGTYTLRSVATDAAGDSETSPPVRVIVDNGSGPTTAVVSPPTGTTLTGSHMVSATASGSGSVSEVQFAITGAGFSRAVVGTATPTPDGGQLSWDTADVPDGSYVLQSVAVDANGATKTSPGVTIRVQNNDPPATSLSTPLDGQTLSGTQALGATASAGLGVGQVVFCLNGGDIQNQVIATGTQTLVGYLADWNSATVPDGAYTLYSVVSDDAGNRRTSNGILVVVDN